MKKLNKFLLPICYIVSVLQYLIFIGISFAKNEWYIFMGISSIYWLIQYKISKEDEDNEK